MVRWIRWPPGELVERRDTHSPFHRRDATPIRLTLYLPLAPVPGTTGERAISLLLALRRHGEHLSVTFANSSDVPRVEIAPTPMRSQFGQYFEVTITGSNSVTRTGVPADSFETHVDALGWRASQRLGGSQTSAEDIRAALLQVSAHVGTRNDLLVTNSPVLLALRDDPVLRRTNVVGLDEATRVVGLLFRHRDTIALRNWEFDGRWAFYLILGKVRVPELDRYWSACVYSRPQRTDDLFELGQSINIRLHRALELRDEIGCQFYQQHTNYTRDYTMAFLDYWALMLIGALDAQARMTIRAYSLPLREQTANFRDRNFPIQLEKAGAPHLAEILKDAKNRAVLTLCRQLRNTIHGASYTAIGTTGFGDPSSFVRVAKTDATVLRDAATTLGHPAARGLSEQSGELWFEPYSFAHTLTSDVLRLVNTVAAATDVTRFFNAALPQEFTNPRQHRGDDDMFNPETLADVDLLG